MTYSFIAAAAASWDSSILTTRFLLQTYKVITIPSPDPLERPSQSSNSGGHTSGRSSAVHSNNTNGSSGGQLQRLREDGSVRGNSLSDRATAFATTSATAAQQAGNGGPGSASGQQQQQESGQELRVGSAPVQPVTTVDRPATGRFTTTSDGHRMRTMSVRIDPEAEIDEEQYMNGEHFRP
jgi:hypothetical protein